MVSTYLTYRTYTQNPVKTSLTKANDPIVSREAAYYKENIGDVKSVDEFFDNYRLYAYAMKAYGLEDMTYAKAFMRKVLASDLSDTTSFANKLSDSRYREFAAAFSFAADGAVANAADIQTSSQAAHTLDLYEAKNAVPAETSDYTTYIGGVDSVDELFLSKNAELLDYALTAYGFDPEHTSKDPIRGALTSDLSDPSSYANTKGGKLLALARAFNFGTGGNVVSGMKVQSETQIKATTTAYAKALGYVNGTATETAYYSEHIADVATVDVLLRSDRLRSFALTAYGLSPDHVSDDFLRQVLTSDLSDPASRASTLGGKYLKLAQAFNFDTGGSIKAGCDIQSTTQLDAMTTAYTKAADLTSSSSVLVNKINFQNHIDDIETVDDLLGNAKFAAFVRSAYDLDEGSISNAVLKKVLQSDISDPNSYANQLGDAALLAFAADFNFDLEGKVAVKLAVQSSSSIATTTRAYAEAVNATSNAEKADIKAATTYYNDTITGITSLADLLADEKLADYIVKAFNLEDENLTKAELKEIFTSDIADKRSHVNQQTDARYRKLAMAFNFDAAGLVVRETPGQAQARSGVQATYNAYLQQTIETEAGVENEAVRLALYFERKAPSITNAYKILADNALLAFTQTALGLPSGMSTADIDVQAAMIEKRLDVADLQDPEKLGKLVARFCALYDAGSNTALSNGAVALLSTSTAAGLSADLLATVQNTAATGG